MLLLKSVPKNNHFLFVKIDQIVSLKKPRINPFQSFSFHFILIVSYFVIKVALTGAVLMVARATNFQSNLSKPFEALLSNLSLISVNYCLIFFNLCTFSKL